MHVTLYNVPAAGAGFLPIPATQPTRRVGIIEDDSVQPQGLIYKLPYDNFVQTYDVAPGKEIVLGNEIANFKGKGNFVGLPKQMDRSGTVQLSAATVMIEITSSTATPTTIRVTEID